MKEKEIISTYKIDIEDFKSYLMRNNLSFSESMFGGIVVDDSLIALFVSGFLEEKNASSWSIQEKEREAAAKRAEKERIRALEAEEAARKRKALSEMLITSGFNFDGYRVVKYSGYISGDDAMSVDRGYSWANVSVRDKLMASLTQIRRNALRELKEAAYDLGCNAIIGVDFDYITLDPQTANLSGGTTYQPYVFCVTANGNAVVIEKIED